MDNSSALPKAKNFHMLRWAACVQPFVQRLQSPRKPTWALPGVLYSALFIGLPLARMFLDYGVIPPAPVFYLVPCAHGRAVVRVAVHVGSGPCVSERPFVSVCWVCWSCKLSDD